jgi:hypothetical protein
MTVSDERLELYMLNSVDLWNLEPTVIKLKPEIQDGLLSQTIFFWTFCFDQGYIWILDCISKQKLILEASDYESAERIINSCICTLVNHVYVPVAS